MNRRVAGSREIVFSVLQDYRSGDAFVTDLLDRALRSLPPESSDRGRAREMTLGVVRRQLTLDTIIQALAHGKPKIEPKIRTLLRMGIFELLFLKTPAHAAVHETVSLAKRVGAGRTAGFINAILRELDRQLTEEVVHEPGSRAIPIARSEYRVAKRDFFPDPAGDWPGCFSQAFSVPAWLAERWAARFSGSELINLGFAINASPGITLRVNSMRKTREEVLAGFESGNIEASAGELPMSLHLPKGGGPLLQFAIDSGAVSVQDESAQFAVRLLSPQAGERVLDLCAAPGTKTAAIAEAQGDAGNITACDSNPGRLKRVDETIGRLELKSVSTKLIAGDGTGLPNGPFEAALVDVPCSNTGVMAKRPDVRWRVTENDLHELPILQLRLLRDAARRIAPGGRIVYSTCSIEAEENNAVVREFLSQAPEFSISSESLRMPEANHDGAYAALLVRN